MNLSHVVLPDRAEDDTHIDFLLNQRQPLIINDLEDQSTYAKAYNNQMRRVFPSSPTMTGSLMLVPLVMRDQLIGLIRLSVKHRQAFKEHDASLALGFANQTAALIELVRNHEAGLKAAAKTERSRLARELHDSVSQALFGIVLGLRTSIQYIDNGADAKSTVQYALGLAELGLLISVPSSSNCGLSNWRKRNW